MCRLVADPEVRYTPGDESKTVARFRVASNRTSNGEQVADFFSCKAFGRQAIFAEKFLHKGTKILLEGNLQVETYENREGKTVYGTVIYVNSVEFAESKAASEPKEGQAAPAPRANAGRSNGVAAGNGFMNIPEGIEDEFPFPCN